MNLLRSITIHVELSAGTMVRDAACDLCSLSDRIGVLVEADFNGVKLWARPGDNPLQLEAAYHRALSSKATYKIAQA